MRLVGDDMLVGVKDAVKLIGISIIACCATLVCTMFLNFYFDICLIENEITSESAVIFYNAQVSIAKVICFVSGGCLLMTSVIMLLFYIKHYIDNHKKELGILKALGYSNLKIAKNFWVFGISVFIGTVIGFGGAFLIMPKFYELQNKDKILPEISIHFHPTVFLCFVILPTAAFVVLAICYACYKLKKPVLMLLKDNLQTTVKAKKHNADKDSQCSFIDDLKKNTIKSRKTLTFFVFFASFCFSSMVQMSFSTRDLSSELMAAMMLLMGLVLAFTILVIAITTVIHGNTKTIAMMRVFGYSQKECCRAILSGYRPISYLGFAIGTVYQHALLRMVVVFVFKDIDGIPVYKFNVPVMLITLVVFMVSYEIVMYVYSERIKKISIKEVMLES